MSLALSKVNFALKAAPGSSGIQTHVDRVSAPPETHGIAKKGARDLLQDEVDRPTSKSPGRCKDH